MNKKLVSVSDMAKELDVSKSLLHYYCKNELVEIEGYIGNSIMLDRIKTKQRLVKIKQYKKKGLSMKDIAKEFKK